MTYPFASRHRGGSMSPRHAQLVETTMIWGGTSTGAANAQAITPEFTADLKGHPTYVFIAGYSNTGAVTLSTLAADGTTTGSASLRKADGTAMTGGEIVAGTAYQVVFDGTYWRLIGGAGSSGAFTAALSKSSSYTLTASDGGAVVKCTAAIPITLPPASGLSGVWTVTVSNRATSAVTIVCSGADTINGGASFTLRAGWDLTIYRSGSSTFEAINLGSPVAESQATWNPAAIGSTMTLSNGNMTATGGVSNAIVLSTIGATYGRRYFEVFVDRMSEGNKYRVGLAKSTANLNTFMGNDANSWCYVADGTKVYAGTGSSYGATYTTSNVIGIIWDADAGKMWVAKNNVVQGGGDPVAGTNPMFTGVSGTLFPAVGLTKPAFDDNIATGRFALSQFSYSPPTGYTTFY